MQTFLPYPNFTDSLSALDWKRLGKQRVEAMQILNAINDPTNRWRNHPAVLMWVGYEPALKLYHNLAIIEWKKRGYNNTMELYPFQQTTDYPSWIGNEEFHRSHRANLKRKAIKDGLEDWYRSKLHDYNELNPGDLYIWPTKDL